MASKCNKSDCDSSSTTKRYRQVLLIEDTVRILDPIKEDTNWLLGSIKKELIFQNIT